jgi:hypothetical protein
MKSGHSGTRFHQICHPGVPDRGGGTLPDSPSCMVYVVARLSVFNILWWASSLLVPCSSLEVVAVVGVGQS